MNKYDDFELVEGKGYFSGYKCKNCGREKINHIDEYCIDDARKSFPSKLKTKYEPNYKKPIFLKFVL